MAEYRVNYTQSNFTGGIIAAELYGRNDFNKVKTGMKKCTNWTIREAGGLEFRRGTRYLQTIPDSVAGRFKMASLDETIFFFCDDCIRYIDSEGAWQTLAYPEDTSVEPAMPVRPVIDRMQFTELNRRLYYYDSYMKLCEIILTNVPGTISIEQTEGSSLSDIDIDQSTFEAYVGTTQDITLVFAYDGTAEEWKSEGTAVQLSDYGITYSGTPVDNDELTVNYLRQKFNVPQTQITTFESAPTGATITSEKKGTAPDVYVEVRHEYTFALAKDETHESIRFAGTTYQDANAELTAKNSSDSKGQQVNLKITLTNDQATEYAGGKILVYKKYQGYFYFLTAVDIVSGTTVYDGTESAVNRLDALQDKGQVSVDMSKTPKENQSYLNEDGSVSNVNSIADYNQRLFLTRSGQEATHIIFSQVGNTDNLAFSSQRNEDEAGYLELPISNYDSWCRVVSGLDLILSTSYTISKVSGYGDLTTETILWDGLSKNVEPVRTRRSLIYTNTSNRNIYDLTYNEYGQYDSVDLTLLIKYIFETKTIRRLAFKDYPVKTIYVLCDDGDLYCLTYIKDQNIYAWYKIEHEGTIEDICVVNTDTEDELYIVVNYGSKRIIERAYHRTDTVYMDCVLPVQLEDITGNVVTGLDIFEGKRVRVFDTGNNLYYGDYDIRNPQTIVEGGKTVEIDDVYFDGFLVTNGSITLPSDIELKGTILVGLPYYAVMETIPLEFQDSNGNSTIGRKKAVNDAYLRYGDSRGVTYKTMGHEYDCGICDRDVKDNAQFLERGQVKLHTASEYKWDSTIKILQRQPYPARIESITLGITFNDKS